jgi:agmatinase
MSTSGFLEDKFEPGAPTREPNRFTLSLIPYEETTTYRRGTARAPEAIVDASGHVEVFDETMHIDASRHGVLTLRPEITDLASITAHARAVCRDHPESLPGFLGGEHAVTPAIIEGVARDPMGIVWIDAHADLRESFYGRRDNHACAGFNSLPFGPMVQVGIRALAEEEHRLLTTSDRVKAFAGWGEAARAAIEALPQQVYLSVDMDGFAPEVVRAVGTPEPGGLYWAEVMDLLDFLFARKRVIAYDVVELCPVETDVASEFIAARLTYKIMTLHAWHRLGGDAGPED